ncbi:MAG: glutamine--fructose-6-phosphate transaminase (isomerizing) [Candidatus Yanofskybacteria bacterium]|nr:glutamine--fructose-6-phosphate transaminase (isomerizing) [Candidatus Yanofskybacteria bacterium]
MCGIAGYIGKKEGLETVLEGLKRVEYRGYDSAGVLFFQNGKPVLVKRQGKLANLERVLRGTVTKGKGSTQGINIGTGTIGHTRWATHGMPDEINAHPHHDCKKEIFLVHNGIIENHQELKDKLTKLGHKFRSQTDTEVVVHLLEENLKKIKNFDKTLKKSLREIVGAYAFAIVYTKEPDKIYFARLGSPLVLGLGIEEFYLASDPAELAGKVKKVIYLKDGQAGWISGTDFKLNPVKSKIENLNLTAEQAQKGNFPHFMLKEIFEEPEAIRTAMRGRLFPKKDLVKLGGLESVAQKLKKIEKIEIIACGTSYHAGLLGELLFEEVAGISTKTIEASEYRYRQNAITPNTAHLFISQSGETADTIAALWKANRQKGITLGLVNVVGSTIARETKAGVYNHAGLEIGVASTKAFISQVTILNLIALYLSENKSLKRKLSEELALIPKKIELILKQNRQIKSLAKKYLKFKNFMFIGRKYNYPTAIEGALKLKEISYVHAEGKTAGELKHGPIALIEPNFPTVALVNKNSVYEKMLSNLQEIKARKGKIIAIATSGDKKIAGLADDVIFVPKTLEPLEPLLNIVPLQLFAYHFGTLLGYDVDKPRNLAKSVTVE